MAENKKLVNMEALEQLAQKLKDELDKVQVAPSGSVYRPAGNLTIPDPSKLTEENVGNVYNITQEFTTDENFVEDSDRKYPAGTDIAVVGVGSGVYKFNALSGFVDLNGYIKDEDVLRIIEGEIVDSSEVEQMLQEVFREG